MASERRRVIKIAVRKLFGLYDHIIPIDTRERITIIHQPIGVGKTVLLRLVSHFFSGKYAYLERTPFAGI